MNSDSLSYPRATAASIWHRWGGVAAGAVVVVLLLLLFWYLMSDTASTKREVPAAPMLMLPPPPPLPEKLPEPEPEPVKQEMVEPEPTPVEPLDSPVEENAPDPSQDMADPVTIDGAAQAGSDAFGISAGRGGGMTGGGLGGITFSRYVSSILQQAFARDPRTRHLSFEDIRLNVWIDGEGKVSRAELIQGTGSVQIDDAVLSMLREFRVDERPPASVGFPLRIAIKGRRP